MTGTKIPERRFERLDGGFAAAATRGGITRVMVHGYGQVVTERTGPPEFAEVARLWEKVTGDDISGGHAVWADAFTNSRGLALSYRRGRVLLAGDAAHWHMPIGGQSLNVALQDAVNLGWKLAGVINGWASPQLLDSYHAERRPVAVRVLDYVAAQELLLLGGPEIEPLRAVLAELIGLHPARDHLARVVSNLDDRYPASGSPLAGRRFPNVRMSTPAGPLTRAALLSSTEPVIVRLGPDGREPPPVTLPGGYRIPVIHAQPEPPGAATGADLMAAAGADLILIRPDGYVAWAGADPIELNQVIQQLFG